MVLSIKDPFSGSDANALGSDWTLLNGDPGVLDHSVIAESANEIVALRTAEMDSLEVMVRARVSIEAAASPSLVELYARAELLSGSPQLLDKCYIARLIYTATTGLYSVQIQTVVASSGTPITLATGSVTPDDLDSHLFMVKVREHARGTQIDVFVDSEAAPVLSYADTRNLRPRGMLVGFGLVDAGVAEEVTLTDFLAYCLRSSVIKITAPPVKLMTFSDLAYHAKYRLDRAGNSQFPDEYIKDFINFAQDEVYNELLPWKWAFRLYNMATIAGENVYELPPYIALLYDMVNQSIGYQLSAVTEQDLNRTEPLRNRSGGPYSFTVTGRGDFGGWVVRVEPTPSGQVCLELPYYARPVPMEEDNDIPLIPSNWLEILIFGALRRGSQYDTDTAFYRQNERSWAHMMNRMKRAQYTDMKHSPRMRVENLLIREKSTSVIGPTTRSQQLGL